MPFHLKSDLSLVVCNNVGCWKIAKNSTSVKTPRNHDVQKKLTDNVLHFQIRTKLLNEHVCTDDTVPSVNLINKAIRDDLGMSSKRIQCTPAESFTDNVIPTGASFIFSTDLPLLKRQETGITDIVL
ncbi:hypothetical protein CI610_03660 [invertebrate metagenome]|uniref:Paired domain-containing protein n=1 Tax=invertebrate metagenome TaxID=1711999 RepID=A0A2H9T2H7_9ZZZZ